MAPGRRSGGGCWTCRLRHKRCDAVQPDCGSCQSLGIICYSGNAKPSWMDGGVEQKYMSQTIKGRIKHNTLLRRERRRLARNDQGIIISTKADHHFHTSADSALASNATIRHHDVTVQFSPAADSTASTLPKSSVGQDTVEVSIDRTEEFISPFTIPHSAFSTVSLPTRSSLSSSGAVGFASPIPVHLGSVMIYLDYVFPFLFPFYQPSLTETGRQWVLGLLCQNEVSFHIAASLSAYFFTLVPQSDGQDMHADCRTLVLGRLVEQMDMAIRSLQNTVSSISRHGAQSSLLDKTRIMEEIIQLLIVEVTVRRNVDWTIHLTPALALFNEIFDTHGSDHPESSLPVLLGAIPSSLPVAPPHHKPLPNTPDQSAFVFFVSLLLFIDIVASTSLGEAPVLHNYYSNLLSSNNGENCNVRLEAVVGCHNWALVAIGNISALGAWKRDAKRSGNFSAIDLVNRASPISQALKEGLLSLDVSTTCSEQKKNSASRPESYYSRHDRDIDHNTIANITRIWAYAAKIYLSVGLSGWQVNSNDIQSSVAKVLSLLQAIESPAQLRSLSWPICVAGCLALTSQEHSFRCVIGTMGHLGEFGTVFDTLRIMEAVWSSRDKIDADSWDIASCLRMLGSSSLLI